jgi:hypothetical protein
MMVKLKYFQHVLAMLVITAASSFSVAQANPISMQSTLQVDVAGALDNDERGAATNVIWDFHVGSLASITSLKWDVNITSNVGSYLSEMKLTFTDTVGNGVTFTPGDGDDFDGTADYAGFQDLGDLGKIFQVGEDGILRLEFHDGYKDLAFDEPEGRWNTGTLTFGVTQVPEPSTAAMTLGGLLVLAVVAGRRRF